MLAKIRNLFAKPVANNVLYLERLRRQIFFDSVEGAILQSDLTRNNIERVMHNAREIWDKHCDGVPGYSDRRECERMAIEYLNLRLHYQRNDQRPTNSAPWSPRVA